ncbi:alpha/beta hydrolase family protein [Clostridium lacusfryxellense]|uniref:alpha/beta hydrolase family protein n=1 Tax=Clostridium lacusfryxellense TaxID=205328 RepID=UPI001C0B95D3|nr:prolyl oligopeptidase family serine peptidase [Clostridium lacusfryxellense]MBU3114747.1 prolyl oligopeptidase family serine peptidase [Clostridium lacusfryxellense]
MKSKKFIVTGILNNENSFSCKGYEDDNEILNVTSSRDTDSYELKLGTEFLMQYLENKTNDVELILEHNIVTSGEIPVLYCYPKSDKPLPVVIFAHGMFGDKIIDLHRGIVLAQEGFFVVLADARFHGERIVENYSQYFYENDKVVNCKKFLEVIKGTSEDISKVIDNLKDDRRVDLNRIGMSGISMGGYVTFLTLANDDRIKVAAPMLSSPDWVFNTEKIEQDKYDEELKEIIKINNPINNYKRIASIPLLIQNAIDDPTISINGVRQLIQTINKDHSEIEQKYSLIEYPNIGHEVPDIMIDRIIQWFKKYL